MKKKLFTLLICAFACVGAKADVSVTTEGDYTVVTVTGDAGQLGSNDLSSQLSGVTHLKLVGKFNNDPDFMKLKGWCNPTHLDLTGAIIDQGTVEYTYYYLDTTNGQKNVRYKLSKDETGWFYTLDNVRKDVADADVRIYTANTTNGGQTIPGEWKGTLKYISLPTSSDYQIVPYAFCADFDNLEEIVIPNNIKVLGNQSFKSNNSKLHSVTLPNGLVAICEEAFYGTKIETISIPGTVEIICKDAFTNCGSATKLILESSGDPTTDASHHMIVKYYAFYNLAALKDIYVNTTALVDCENNAFDARITWGQGNASASTFCTLHFKADVADHYANLAHPLTTDVAMDPGKFHKWLLQHVSFASNPTSNGWFEFINNGTIEEKEDEIKGTKFLCTYSDYNYDRIVPAGVKAYIVTGLSQNTAGDYSLNLVQLLVIPKRTGVILYGVPNSKNEDGDPVLSMSLCEIANGLPLRRDYWYALDASHADLIKNYLWPSCVTLDPNGYTEENYVYYNLDSQGQIVQDEQGDYSIEVKTRKVLKEATKGIAVKPYDEQNKFVTPEGVMDGYDATKLNGFYRNFYMSRYGTTNSGKAYKKENGGTIESNFVGFFRAKKSTIAPGKAFLRLSTEEYSNAQGGEVIINGDVAKFPNYDMLNYQVEYSKTQENKILLPSESGYWLIDENANPNMKWENDDNWGDRTKVTDKTSGAKFVAVTFTGEPEILENGDGTATMIVPSSMIQSDNSDDYYNLHGVKVANPGKGVYIKNGKKVVLN